MSEKNLVTKERMYDYNPHFAHNWLVLPPGTLALFRRPIPQQFVSAFSKLDCELATGAQLGLANLGYLFPWGDNPDATQSPNPLWHKHRIGYSGLYHTAWFRTRDGRFFGAPNVPTSGHGALRCCILYDGGNTCDVSTNEGYALVRATDVPTQHMYYDVQVYAADRVGADGGRLLVSPIDQDGVVRCGFTGRCLECQNLEKISAPTLQETFPQYRFELWPEWQNWRIPRKPPSMVQLK